MDNIVTACVAIVDAGTSSLHGHADLRPKSIAFNPPGVPLKTITQDKFSGTVAESFFRQVEDFVKRKSWTIYHAANVVTVISTILKLELSECNG